MPATVEFQDGERIKWNPANKREVEEFIRRNDLYPYIQQDPHVTAILKMPPLPEYKLEEFKEEWRKFVTSDQSLKAVFPGAEIEFVECERKYLLHNHPKMEMLKKVP